jgi:hypothetical protein
MKQFIRIVSLFAAMLPLLSPVCPAVDSIDMSSWKTFRDEVMGFEVQYPPDWKMRVSEGKGIENVTLEKPAKPGTPGRSLQFSIQRKANLDNLPIQAWHKERLKQAKAPPSPVIPTTLGGRPAIIREGETKMGMFMDYYAALNKTDIFQISLTTVSIGAELEPTYEAILSTVKFTE